VAEHGRDLVLDPDQTAGPPGRLPQRPQLIAAIEHFIEGYNERAQPFVWTETPEQVLAKAIQKQDTSETLH
jgi:hypothetical protein